MQKFGWLTKKIGLASIMASMLLLVTGAAQAVDALDIRIPVQVFADVGAFSRTVGSSTSSSSSVAATPEHNGAFTGALTLFASPQLGDHVRGLFELVSEFNSDGTNDINVERAQIGYVFNDAATVWGGRFHTPYGYWNTAYHHGAQLQPSIARPVQLSGALPAHTVGMWTTGLFNAGSGKLSYDVYGGNSTRVMGAPNGSIDPNHTSGDNKNKNFGFNIGYNWEGTLNGLRTGVHAMTAKVTGCTNALADACTTAITRSRVKMSGAYANYDNYNVELIAEYYRFKNTNLVSATDQDYQSNSSSGFVQLGYGLGNWIPFMRYEETSYDQKDEFFKSLSNGKSYNKNIAGVRYDLNSNAVLKAEYSQIQSRTAPHLDDSEEVRVQYAVRF